MMGWHGIGRCVREGHRFVPSVFIALPLLMLAATQAGAQTDSERVEALASPCACAEWLYEVWGDPNFVGPPGPPPSEWNDEPLAEVYAAFVAQLKLHPRLASLLYHFLVADLTEEECGFVVSARSRPYFEQFLDRWMIPLVGFHDSMHESMCRYHEGDTEAWDMQQQAQRWCYSVPRSIAHIAFTVRSTAIVYLRGQEQPWRSEREIESARQRDALIALFEGLLRESAYIRTLPEDHREIVLTDGLELAREKMRDWLFDPFQFATLEPMTPELFDAFTRETETRFETIIERPFQTLRPIAAPASAVSYIIHQYVASPKRHWDRSDTRLFPLGEPQSLSYSTRHSGRFNLRLLHERLIPEDGLRVVLQHPEVLAGNHESWRAYTSDPSLRVPLPDPERLAEICGREYFTHPEQPDFPMPFDYLDFLDQRINPETTIGPGQVFVLDPDRWLEE